jgi:hypothetical protein
MPCAPRTTSDGDIFNIFLIASEFDANVCPAFVSPVPQFLWKSARVALAFVQKGGTLWPPQPEDYVSPQEGIHGYRFAHGQCSG